MTDDLVERLQEIALGYLAECNKAADRIEALEAENERLRKVLEHNQQVHTGAKQ